MNFYILTLFPQMVELGLNYSIIKKARDNNHITIKVINIRDFANNKHNKVDDYPYGGGCGMLMKAEPIYLAYKSLKNQIKRNSKVIYMSPQGKLLNQKKIYELSKEEDIVILCGHYEGVDERVIEEIVTEEISIGNFISTGGELPAMLLVDSVSRLVEGVLNKKESYKNESFENNLLEYPQYTRPKIFLNKEVPEILLSGNHEKIKLWKQKQSYLRTKIKRPDLLKKDIF